MHKEKSGTEIHLGQTEARAGSRTKLNRNVLVASLLLVLIAFLIIVGFGYLETDKTGADEVASQNAQTTESM